MRDGKETLFERRGLREEKETLGRERRGERRDLKEGKEMFEGGKGKKSNNCTV